ncbi:MAG: queuosine precursor transporter [Phyllobacteriaceae bacterium]|nr:queuosine precursor transporter [Phyllobacteriaceae bacterium]
MTVVVVASNLLVQFPVQGAIGGVALADILTWGAFTYPVAFLVTDLANRAHGPAAARRVIYAGFALAVACSLIVPPLLFSLDIIGFETPASRLPRIAMASGAAFLVGQLLDVTVFNRLRRQTWWRAPVFASLAGSVIDTALFFTLAFAPAIALLGANDDFSLERAPLIGVFAATAPRWISWALGDLAVKLLVAVFALIHYRLIAARWSQPVAA